MAKRSSKPTKPTTKKKQPSDINLLAAQIVEAATGPPEKPTLTPQPETPPPLQPSVALAD